MLDAGIGCSSRSNRPERWVISGWTIGRNVHWIASSDKTVSQVGSVTSAGVNVPSSLSFSWSPRNPAAWSRGGQDLTARYLGTIKTRGGTSVPSLGWEILNLPQQAGGLHHQPACRTVGANGLGSAPVERCPKVRSPRRSQSHATCGFCRLGTASPPGAVEAPRRSLTYRTADWLLEQYGTRSTRRWFRDTPRQSFIAECSDRSPPCSTWWPVGWVEPCETHR